MAEKKNYDSDFCGSLPLNQINVVQDHGYLLAIKNETLNVIQFSENLAGIILLELNDLLNKQLSDLFKPDDLHKITDRLQFGLQLKAPLVIELMGHQMEALIHQKEGFFILEMERKQYTDRFFTEAFEGVKLAIARLEACRTVEEVSAVGIAEIQKITGFNGVMMYRFDEDWNGTVIAEEKSGELERYLGHTFPASDIPRQARQLYLKNPYRLISNREYKPVRLYPVLNPLTKSFTDLSDLNIRGVAAVHLEYLKNMNVTASMSIRVIYHGELWGLIACHHTTTKYLSLEVCSVCELLSTIISARIESLSHRQMADAETYLQKEQTKLMAQVYATNDLFEGLLNEGGINLAGVLNADGVVAVINGETAGLKNIPPPEFVEDLILWLQTRNIERVYATDRLPDAFEDAGEVSGLASGILALPINLERGDVIICFKGEVKREIKWGGNPNEAINFELDGKNYHPRNSFKLWQQTVHHTSLPWTDQEVAAAEVLRSFIYEFYTKNNRF
ncbi:GAF domain-containing protein [Mucilaginibacter terrae]|uniref:Chemotaxis family two-component system sensor kinase Cph1 n=1 Tax=Mucilaginibacter terrae TaxID=1955052 RepID=A0ABU3GNK6_9SPHI|nr:GAF domain-containing protein [Mucilaginibacter terrae]MDT3401374.1 chemotaxis family two-component system sensor kinase Cph1 [Mucilaginibacter terrae]